MMAKILEGRPAKMGFRMPAEWEPHEQCWMGWPVRTPPSLPCFFPSDLPFFFVLLVATSMFFVSPLSNSVLVCGRSSV